MHTSAREPAKGPGNATLGGVRERRADLVVIGAGIVGLAHAWHARRAGLDVLVIERDEFAVGASVRNFGHIGATAQGGRALDFAVDALEDWLTIAGDASLPVRTDGTVVIARTATENEVLEQFAAARGDGVRLLDAGDGERRLGFRPPGMVSAAHFPADLRVDAPTAIPAIAQHLAELGVRFLWRTNVLDLGEETVCTSRGYVRAERIIVAVGHDTDRFFPGLAEGAAVRRCRLRMLEVDPPGGAVIPPAVLTGTAMLRYEGLAAMPAAEAVRAELSESQPRLLDAQVNLMLTQRPNGRLVLGDTHTYEVTESPFEDESADLLLLDQFERLLGVAPRIRRRWRGVYASSADSPFLVAEPVPGVTVAAVTTGIGMTTAFGLARSVLADALVPG